MPQMMFSMLVKDFLLITCSRKKNTASRKDKNGHGQKVEEVEIAPMGPHWFVMPALAKDEA